MCGACGGGGRAGPTWEDAAGRVDAAGARARLHAARFLSRGTRWQVRQWHGSWVAVAPSGRTRYLRTLDELVAALPPLRLELPGGQPREAVVVPPPAGWHVQAALVWVAAARAAGVDAHCLLPVDADSAVSVEVAGGHLRTLQRQHGGDSVRIEACSAPVLLDSLLSAAAPAALDRAAR